MEIPSFVALKSVSGIGDFWTLPGVNHSQSLSCTCGENALLEAEYQSVFPGQQACEYV
jgi:hypothetical protein